MISLGQAHETELTLEKAGATSEFWTRLAQNLELAKAVVALVMQAIMQFVVDYGRSLADAVKAGCYDYANDDITEEHFPAEEWEKGQKEQSFRLYHFGRDMGSDDAVVQMDKDGFRPATVRELLAFGEKNPELQRQFPIIALKQSWVGRDGYRSVACLGKYDAERELYLTWYGNRWRGNCRVLAVRK